MRTMLMLAVLAVSGFAADKPDASGTWICNLDQSKFGKMPKPQSLTLKVERRGEILHSVQTTDDGQGPRNNTEGDWFMDGKIHPVDPKATGNKITSMSKWDGNTLVAEKKSDDGTFVERIRITFSGDSRKATERISVKSADGSGDTTLVWEKK